MSVDAGDSPSESTASGLKRSPKGRGIFGRLRLRSRSVANLSREKSSYFSSWFSKRPTQTPEATLTNDGIDNSSEASAVLARDLDRQLSVSHYNIHPSGDAEMHNNGDDNNAFFGNSNTSRLPSYVSISLVANGYSRSRTNLNSVLSRSGDVHHLMVDGADIKPLNSDHKSVIFVGNQLKNMSSSSLQASYVVPEFEVGTESDTKFFNLTQCLQTTLTNCVENGDALLANQDLCDEVREAVLVAVGHTKVLLKSKVKKMFQLIEKYKDSSSEVVTLNDLGSFWTMLDLEVAKIREQFALVERYRLNEWKPLPVAVDSVDSTPRETPQGTPKFKPPRAPVAGSKPSTPRNGPTSTPRNRSNVRDFLAARRKELAEKQNGHSGEMTLISTQ